MKAMGASSSRNPRYGCGGSFGSKSSGKGRYIRVSCKVSTSGNGPTGSDVLLVNLISDNDPRAMFPRKGDES